MHITCKGWTRNWSLTHIRLRKTCDGQNLFGTNKNQDNFKFKTDYTEQRTMFNNLLHTAKKQKNRLKMR